MIDATNIKSPGWQRVVAELNAPAADDRAYMERMLRVLGQVAASRQAALFVPVGTEGQVEVRLEMIWPPVMQQEAGADLSAGLEVARETTTAARAAAETAQSRVFSLDKSSVYYDAGSGGGAGGSSGTVIAVPLLQVVAAPSAPPGTVSVTPVGVITLLIEPRGQDAVRSTLAMAEVLAGYLQGHGARQALKRTQRASLALDLGTRLIAAMNTAPNFKGACLQLVNDLSKQFSLDRVAMGWVKGDTSRVQAISDIEHFDNRTQMVQKIATAMDECLDQEQPVMHPPPPLEGPSADTVLGTAIAHAHRELAAGNSKLKVCSLPLRVDEGVVGVITLESAGEGAIDVATVEMMQSALDLVAPVLKVRRSDDRNLVRRLWGDVLKAGAWFVGPKQTAWKLVGLLAISAIVFSLLYRTTYRPGAEATLEPRVRRIVSAPLEGIIKRLGDGIEPGKRVEVGQTLVEMDTTEWVLGLAESQAKVTQALTQASAARAARQQDKAVQAELEAQAAERQVERFRYRIDRSRITAPIAGTIITGDIKDRVGSTIKLGDQLFQIADLSDIIVTARVDERDIALVKTAFDQGRGTGAVATKGKPDETFGFKVDRIVPLASAVDGKNVFEVRGTLSGAAEWFRPGMEGIAKFDTERMSIARIATRRIIDQARLWLWWW